MINRNEQSELGDKLIKSVGFNNGPIKAGTTYVRVRPPDHSEGDDVKKDVRWLKFTRVGVFVTVLDEVMNDEDCVFIRCGGDSMVWDQKEFRRTFIRLVHGDEFLKNEMQADGRL